MGLSIYRPKTGSKEIHQLVINVLGKHGSKICHIAAHSHETGRDTGAQENAYGYGIYYNGEIVDWRPCASVRPQERPNDVYWGHKELKKFFAEYHPSLSGYTLVIVNAMFYSAMQEEGHMAPRKSDLVTKSGRKKARQGQTQYRIISQTYGMMKTALKEISQELNLKSGWSKAATIWHWTRQSDI